MATIIPVVVTDPTSEEMAGLALPALTMAQHIAVIMPDGTKATTLGTTAAGTEITWAGD